MGKGLSFPERRRAPRRRKGELASSPRPRGPIRDLTAAALGIHLESGQDGELFKWFLASFLFGKRIQWQVALRTYDTLVRRYRRDTPRKIHNCSWQQLVEILDEGHYVRYDESTAERLKELASKLIEQYGGRISNIRGMSRDRTEVENRLLDFNGVGPKTLEIFMREAAPVWFKGAADHGGWTTQSQSVLMQTGTRTDRHG